MRCQSETVRRPFGALLFATALVAIAMACGEQTSSLLPAASPTEPEPTLTAFVFLADANGSVLGRLAEGRWPSWSPDGRRIAFHRDARVRVIGVDGAGETDLAEGQWATWSPDGARIAFSAPEGLSVMNADGSSVRRLMSPALIALHDWGVGKPSWSPDGALIVFDEPEGYDFGVPARIFAMSADGASQYILSGESRYETEPSWSPDGSRVVFWSDEFGVGIVERGGGHTVQLYKDQKAVAFSARPSWSPDGRAILFSRSSPNSSIMVISPDGENPRVLIEQGIEAAWSPDGKRIAFVKFVPR